MATRMPDASRPHLFLPAKDRSYWRADPASDLPLQYLAWGHRDFLRDPIPVASHEGWVCMLVEKGWPTLLVKDEAVPMPPNSLVLIGPRCSSGWKPQDADECKIYVWMWREIVSHEIRCIKENDYAKWRLSEKLSAEFVDNHQSCRREIQRLDEISKHYLLGYQQIFEANILRALSGYSNDDAVQGTAKLAVEWMSQHLNSKEPISRLCDYLDTSQSTLHRLYKKQFGVSPLDFFHQMRMSEAELMLNRGTFSIKEIAFKLGYDHFNDFSRAFRKHSGGTPSCFIKSI